MKKKLVVSGVLIFVLFLQPSAFSLLPSISTVPDHIERLLREGKFDEARAELEKFRHESPDNARAIFYIARLEKDTNKAIALLKEVEILADSSLAAEAVLARAEMSFSGKSLSDAEDLYTLIVTRYPLTASCAEAHYYLGLIRLVEGSPDDAQVHFEQCHASLSAVPPSYDRTLRILALAGIMECLVARKEWEAAIESARTVLEQDDDNMLTPRVLEVISRSWRELGSENNANHYNERLLKHFPESYQAHALRVHAVSIAGDSGLLLDSSLQSDAALQSAAIDSLSVESDSDENETGETGVAKPDLNAENADVLSFTSFTVQASAFMDKNNALKLFTRLKQAGFDVHLSMKSVADKHFYLVQVGNFKTREEADEMASRVTTFTGVKAHIVNR